MSIVPQSKRRWYERELAMALLANVPAAISSAGAALKSAGNGFAIALNLSALTFNMAGLLLRAHAATKKDKKQDEKESPLDLTACLYILRATILKLKRIENVDDTRGALRITIHQVTGDRIEQLVDYVGGEGGGAKRTFSARSGVTGRVITTGEPQVMERKGSSTDDYIHELTHDWAMPRHEARALSEDRFSFMGIPLKGVDEEGRELVVGVVFFDSSQRQFFTGEILDFAVAACVGVAQYTKFRYAG